MNQDKYTIPFSTQIVLVAKSKHNKKDEDTAHICQSLPECQRKNTGLLEHFHSNIFFI